MKSVIFGLFAGLVSSVVGNGSIISPAHRSRVGPAAEAACGTNIANYIASNTGASNYLIEDEAGSGYNVDACNIFNCGGYQYADNAENVYKFTPSQEVNITVNYTIDALPPVGDTADSYGPILSIVNSTTGYSLSGDFSYGLVNSNSSQVIAFPSIDYINSLFPGTYESNICSQPGECYISYQFYNYYQTPHVVSQRILYSSCLDVVIDWS